MLTTAETLDKADLVTFPSSLILRCGTPLAALMRREIVFQCSSANTLSHRLKEADFLFAQSLVAIIFGESGTIVVGKESSELDMAAVKNFHWCCEQQRRPSCGIVIRESSLRL